jgi:hypothetical protein
MKSLPFLSRVRLPAIVLASIVAGLFVGCQSPNGTGSHRLASVIIKNRPLTDIEAATEIVFTEYGYKMIRTGPQRFTFEKEGTTMNQMAYGDWSGKPVQVRIKLNIRETTATETLVECDAYMVASPGTGQFEEETKLSTFRKGPYQDLLNDIKARLK